MAGERAGIDVGTVRYVAGLCRLELTGDEEELFAAQLSDILNYIDKLNELDTSEVEPLAQAIEIPNVFRDDAPRGSLEVSEALANAPEKTGGFYKVPAVLEG